MIVLNNEILSAFWCTQLGRIGGTSYNLQSAWPPIWTNYNILRQQNVYLKLSRVELSLYDITGVQRGKHSHQSWNTENKKEEMAVEEEIGAVLVINQQFTPTPLKSQLRSLDIK